MTDGGQRTLRPQNRGAFLETVAHLGWFLPRLVGVFMHLTWDDKGIDVGLSKNSTHEEW